MHHAQHHQQATVRPAELQHAVPEPPAEWGWAHDQPALLPAQLPPVPLLWTRLPSPDSKHETQLFRLWPVATPLKTRHMMNTTRQSLKAREAVEVLDI